uniref:PDZ domain-containing protein n=1 Tax=Loa loa TaxID=7209 RepID=A0A1I7VGX0_LOALO
MALELDTTVSSVNGSNNNSNGNTTVIFKTINNDSPCSNDSGFHSDRLQQHQQSRSQRTIFRSRCNIKHKPTYVSVFASDPDCSSPLFDEFDRHFAANRPNFLNSTLHLPTGDEETRSAPSIVAPLITPSGQSASPSFINMIVPSDSTVHPETSKQTYQNKQQAFSASSASTFEQEQQPHAPLSTVVPETPAHPKLHYATTLSNILSSSGISNSNQSMQGIPVQRTYKYARLKTEMQENTAYISEQEDEKSEGSMRESLDDLYSKFQQNLPPETEILNYHFYPRIVDKSEEFYLTLTKSADLPTTKLPHGNSSEPKETVETLDTDEKCKNGKQYDDKVTMKQSSAYDMYHLSPDSVTKPLPRTISAKSGNASPHQSLTRPQEIPISELFASKIAPRHDQGSYGTNLEGPPLQILSLDLELGVTSQEKSENRLLKIEQCSTYDEKLGSLKNAAVKSKDTSEAEIHLNIEESDCVSFVPATELNRIVSPTPDSLRNHDSSGVFEKSGSVVPSKPIPPPWQSSAVSIPRKPEHSYGINRTVPTKELQTPTSLNEKSEKPVIPVAPRRARDDDKPIPFNKLIEKAIFFTKADNGAVPTPKTFQSIAGAVDSSKFTTVGNSGSTGVSKATALNLRTSEKVPCSGSKLISEKFTERNSTYVETSKNRFSVTDNAPISQAGNFFTKARASFEKTAQPLPVRASHNNEKKFVSTVEKNVKVEKFSDIIRQSEKVEKRSSIITKQNEFLEVYSSVMEKEPNTKMHPCLSEREYSVGVMKGLDFSRFDSVTNDEVIGRPLGADGAEEATLQIISEITPSNELHKQGQTSEVELMECKSLLNGKFADYDIFKVMLKKPASNPEGSVGVILSSAASGDQYISVQRVISGSIADRSDLIEKGDRVFFVQGYSTKQMSATDARTLIKQRTEHVIFVLGRPKTKSSDMPAKPAKFVSTATVDPDLFNYSMDPEEVILTKGSLGVGLALDGGRGSVFGDRPIVIKRVFEGGSAARSGRIKVGDRVTTIDGIDLSGMSYLEATKTLRSRPEGPLKLVILRRLQ